MAKLSLSLITKKIKKTCGRMKKVTFELSEISVFEDDDDDDEFKIDGYATTRSNIYGRGKDFLVCCLKLLLRIFSTLEDESLYSYSLYFFRSLCSHVSHVTFV